MNNLKKKALSQTEKLDILWRYKAENVISKTDSPCQICGYSRVNTSSSVKKQTDWKKVHQLEALEERKLS